jgi:uncharacterized protein
MKQLLENTVAHVKKAMGGESSGHDWWHAYRVWRMGIHLAEMEKADSAVVQLGALLHDIADWKFHGGDLAAGPKAAREWLASQHAPSDIIEHVCQIIGQLSFKGAGVPTNMPTIEGRVVQDADRLDAIGAIGIARAFAYGGHDGRMLYDPDHPPKMHTSADAYRNSRGTTVNHFYEKLLLLKDRMQTTSGRAIAERRHEYIKAFLDEFRGEWEGRF